VATILVVEDEILVREVIRMELEAAGYQVMMATRTYHYHDRQEQAAGDPSQRALHSETLRWPDGLQIVRRPRMWR
jgi:DNA-binding response OmpR family regulator